MIVITTASVSAVVFLATLLWWLYAPMYTARAALLIMPPATTPLAGGPNLYNKDIMDRLVLTHTQMVLGESVLDKVTGDRDVQATGWYQADRENAIERLSEEINVHIVPNTNYIQITMTSTAATEQEKIDLATIVNAVATKFVKSNKDMLSHERKTQINELNKERADLIATLGKVRKDKEQALRATSILSLRDQKTSLTMELQNLTNQLTQLSLYRVQTRTALDTLRQQEIDGSIKSSPDVLQALDMDPQLRALLNTQINLVTRLDELARKFGPDHRSIQTVQTQLNSVKNQIDDRERTLTERAVSLMIRNQESTDASITAQLQQVEVSSQEASAKVRDLQSSIDVIERAVAEEAKLETRVDRIDNRLLELRLLEQGEEQVVLRAKAIPPREISHPQWKFMLPLGVILGLGVGLGLAFLLEFIDTSIKSPSEVARRVDLPLLGMIPHLEDLEEEIADLRLAFMTNPDTLICEAFRQIRTCLLFSGPASQQRSLLITSPLPEDGRTTVTLNLAAAIARHGRKVLVVDANFRQPAIRQLFPSCPEGGLSSALVGQGNWRDLVHQVEPNLTVMPSGPLPPNPAELLGSEEMRKLLAEMVEQYDQVLIDGTPCLVVTDSSVLSTLVDGVILTVRAGANTYGIVQRSRDMLLRVGSHIVGVTLNGVRVTAGGYLRKNYETFYEYRDQSRLLTQ